MLCNIFLFDFLHLLNLFFDILTKTTLFLLCFYAVEATGSTSFALRYRYILPKFTLIPALSAYISETKKIR